MSTQANDEKPADTASGSSPCSGARDKETVSALKRALRREPHLLARAERKAARIGITLEQYLENVIQAVRLVKFE